MTIDQERPEPINFVCNYKVATHLPDELNRILRVDMKALKRLELDEDAFDQEDTKVSTAQSSVGVAAVHDASFMQQTREGSQQGYAIMLGSTDLYDGAAVTHLLDWGSSKIHRKVRSTLAAEAAAAARAYDRAIYARAMIAEIENGLQGHWKEEIKTIPFCLGTDCKSLYDLCMKEGSLPDERRVALDLLDIREGIEEIGDKIRWVPTDHMLVDCMTKAMQPDAMLEYLKSGKYAFKYKKEIKDTKREIAKARKKAKEAKQEAKQSPEEVQYIPYRDTSISSIIQQTQSLLCNTSTSISNPYTTFTPYTPPTITLSPYQRALARYHG
jgi:hypothetical protein